MKKLESLLDDFKKYEADTTSVLGGYLVKTEVGMDMVPNGDGTFDTYFDWVYVDSETGEQVGTVKCHQYWNGSDAPEGYHGGGILFGEAGEIIDPNWCPTL